MKLSTNQQCVLNFCRAQKAETGIMPTLQAIAEFMDWSETNRASDLMTSLAARGLARVIDPGHRPRPGAARRWELIEDHA